MRFKRCDYAILAVARGSETIEHVYERVMIEAIGPYVEGVVIRVGGNMYVPTKSGDYIVRLKDRSCAIVHDWQLRLPEYGMQREPLVMYSRPYYESVTRRA